MCFQKRLIDDHYRPATNRKGNQESKQGSKNNANAQNILVGDIYRIVQRTRC